MNRWKSSAVITAAIAVLLWPAARANAGCTNLADTTSTDCKAAATCQTTIWTQAQLYIKTVQGAAASLMSTSLGGKNTTGQKYICMGGPLDAQACVFNNGVCKAPATNVGAPCSVNGDCPSGTCNRLTGAGCNGASIFDDDAVECQPDQRALKTQKAQATLRTNILKKCPTTGTPDVIGMLGLNHIAGCPKAGTAGTCTNIPHAPCNSGTQCSSGICTPDAASQMDELINCITKSADGGFTTGEVVDTTLRVFGKISGSGSNPPQLKPDLANPSKDLLPRQILQLQGANILAIGAGVVNNNDNGSAAGGTITAMALAHCVGGNGNGSCLNDVECGTGGNCVRNTGTICQGGANNGLACSVSVDCPGGACKGVAGDNAVTGTKPVHTSITSNVPFPNGNVLTVTQTTNSLVGPVCLMTRTQDAGNGTPVSGTFNLTTGRQSTHAPVLTNVEAGHKCPICLIGICNKGVNTGQPCTAPSGTTTQECPTDTPGPDDVPNPFNLTTDSLVMDATTLASSTCGFCDTDAPNAACNNPPCNSCITGNACGKRCKKTASTNPGGNCVVDANCGGGSGDCATATCDLTAGLPSKAFCGFCTGNPLVGCQQTTPDCTGNGTCSFATSPPGFFTDCSATHLVVQGEANLYAEKAVGLFCTGKTSNSTLNDGQGLPGPVEVIEPYINAYVFTKDKTP